MKNVRNRSSYAKDLFKQVCGCSDVCIHNVKDVSQLWTQALALSSLMRARVWRWPAFPRYLALVWARFWDGKIEIFFLFVKKGLSFLADYVIYPPVLHSGANAERSKELLWVVSRHQILGSYVCTQLSAMHKQLSDSILCSQDPFYSARTSCWTLSTASVSFPLSFSP